MKVRDFVVSYDRRKLGQITKVIGDNGCIDIIEVRTFSGNCISLLPEEVGEYCDKLIPILKAGDFVNGYRIEDIICEKGEWKAIIKDGIIELKENDIRQAMTREMYSMFSFWKIF